MFQLYHVRDMLKFPRDKMTFSVSRAAIIHIIIYIPAYLVWHRKWHVIIRWLLRWMQGNGEVAGMASNTDIHRCSVVISVHVVKGCPLWACGNFCLNREHLCLKEVMNRFPKGEGRHSKLRGKESHARFSRGARQQQRVKLHLSPTVGGWLMQCPVLLQSIAFWDLKMGSKGATSWTCQEDTLYAEDK